ncbi:MAG: molybdopterin dehydrogenase, partial [Oscillospiraceae bacterium]|nr:molybdopterin dehydrogenase [Oscillospiraceae bacterium]
SINGEYRASVGARPASAILIKSEKEEGFAEYVAASAPTGTNLRGSAAYRTKLIKGLTERALTEIGGI